MQTNLKSYSVYCKQLGPTLQAHRLPFIDFEAMAAAGIHVPVHAHAHADSGAPQCSGRRTPGPAQPLWSLGRHQTRAGRLGATPCKCVCARQQAIVVRQAYLWRSASEHVSGCAWASPGHLRARHDTSFVLFALPSRCALQLLQNKVLMPGKYVCGRGQR